MCGILGVFAKSSISPNVQFNFKKALITMAHRGPDSATELLQENALLGFNRLSIVGIDNGSQPLTNEDSTIFLLCNGEIYNYLELKKKLKQNHKFKTISDCETILHLYEEDLDIFASKLNGQFAFVIYDNNRKQIVLGRDRFGINPLYYAKDQSCIFVASEIKAILALDRGISSSLDPVGLKETLYLYGPTPPRTCFKNIFQVEPGKVITIDINKNEVVKNKRYWKFPRKKTYEIKVIKKEFRRLLIKAVEKRAQGDTSYSAIYLSGGLDSASVAYLLSNEEQIPQAFSIKFKDAEFDESPYQREVSKSLEIPLYSVVGDEVFNANLFQSIWHIEHPLLRTAPLALYSLSQLAPNHGNKFVCCGEGADEMLLGYPVFFKHLSSVEDKIIDYSKLENLFINKEISGQAMVNNLIKKIAKSWKLKPESIRLKQMVEIQTKLTRYLLVQQGDRQSMSHGVEQRFPFLDEKLMNFIFSIPMIYSRTFV